MHGQETRPRVWDKHPIDIGYRVRLRDEGYSHIFEHCKRIVGDEVGTVTSKYEKKLSVFDADVELFTVRFDGSKGNVPITLPVYRCDMDLVSILTDEDYETVG